MAASRVSLPVVLADYLWDPLGAFSVARVDVEDAEGPEVGFTRPVEGTPNVEYLSAADRAAAEALLGTLNEIEQPEGSTP